MTAGTHGPRDAAEDAPDTADSPDGVAAPDGVAGLGRVHLVGVGGVGMSGVARVLLARGVPVSGSDRADSPALASLRAAGARCEVGHDAAHLGAADTLVVSSAVRPDNPELVEARRRGLRVVHRSEALALLMAGRRGAAVAGTHGKTTTTSMLVVALREAGLDPSFAIGGSLTEGGENAGHGSGDVFVAEADESDGSFLRYRPEVSVVTNVEPDHLDHYGTAEAVVRAFDDFCDRVMPGGTLVACADDPGAADVAARAAQRRPDLRVLRYGTAAGAELRLSDVDVDGPGAVARFTGPGTGDAGRVLRLRVPGRHNALDAAAAWCAAHVLGADPEAAARGLESFGGTRRRFELRGAAGGVRVVDDYAHHPTEVTALLRAARPVAGDGRVVAVFQPHLFSRTRIFAADFGRALGLADLAVVLDVYPAREDPEPGVTGRLVADRVPLPAGQVVYAEDADAALAELLRRLRPGDLVLTVGAGDVTALGPRLLAALPEGTA